MAARIFAPLLLLLALLASTTPHALAQAPAITLAARVGFEGQYRGGEWFPVTVDVTNDGPDLRGTLVWQFSTLNEPRFGRAIELARGARQRLTIYAFSRGYARNGEVRIETADGQVAAQLAISTEQIDRQNSVIGVVGSDLGLYGTLKGLRWPGRDRAVVLHFGQEDLPERVSSLRTFDTLFLADIDSARLTEAQRTALTLWVKLGGQLVVGGGLAGDANAAALADLLPATLAPALGQGALAGLAGLAPQDADPPAAQVPLTSATPRPGAQTIPASGEPLLYAWPVGAGNVIASRFDLAATAQWGGNLTLWQAVLGPASVYSPSAVARTDQSNLLDAVLQLPNLGLPSPLLVFAFLFCYIACVGPLNYLLLRRIGRPEWAWITIPAAVALFSAGLYVGGALLRGNQTQVNQAAIVQASEGDARGLATSFVGIFSPTRSVYTLGFDADALVTQTRGLETLDSRGGTVIASDDATQLPDVVVNIGSISTMVSEQPVDVTAQVASELTLTDGLLSGRLRNTGGRDIEDAMIVSGTTFQSIGAVRAGGSVDVSFNQKSAPQSFPWGVTIADSGLFNRRQMLQSIFGDDARGVGQNGAAAMRGIYLVGFIAEPATRVTVNGTAAKQSGVTLYAIRLNVN